MRKRGLLLGVAVLVLVVVFLASSVFGDEGFVIKQLVPDKLFMLHARVVEKENVDGGAATYSASSSFGKSLGDGIIEISKKYSIISIVPITVEYGWGSATSSLIIFVTKK